MGLLTAAQAAKELIVSVRTIYHMIDSGKLSAIVVGGEKTRRFRIEESEIERFKMQNKAVVKEKK